MRKFCDILLQGEFNVLCDKYLNPILTVKMAGTSSGSSEQSNVAQKTWELSNNIENTVDEIYKYDRKQQMDILTAKPWEKE